MLFLLVSFVSPTLCPAGCTFYRLRAKGAGIGVYLDAIAVLAAFAVFKANIRYRFLQFL